MLGRSATCRNTCQLQCNGEKQLHGGYIPWGVPPPLLTSLLDSFSPWGALHASLLSDYIVIFPCILYCILKYYFNITLTFFHVYK